MLSFRLKEEKRSLDADWSRAWCRFLLFTAPYSISTISLVLKWFLITIKKNLPPETAKDINEGLLTNIETFFETRLANILYGPL